MRRMTRYAPFAAMALAAATLVASPTMAEIPVGKAAPAFTARGAMAGKPVTVDLKAALRNGPVVLYFFPAAFTPGCNVEAHTFAQNIAKFKAAGATVIGMTAGNTDQLAKFSSEKCAGKFTVAAASPALLNKYDVSLKGKDGATTGYSSRTTYVIGQDGKVASVYSDMNPAEHVKNSLAAVHRLTGR
ncbi:redoxin domain-containing protein [Erythrobacter sp. 3-20A1M]|nr:peroxiredoxin [Erythrobacter sp. 3-20A1M]QWC58204.1 redoxin domain-containing protein [Erythrobacter sp. 3-20A1M]